MNDIHIRPATSSDAGAIARLLAQLGYPTKSADVPERLERLMVDDRAVILLAERDTQVVGLATVHILSVMNRQGDVAWLTALVVDEPARGTGVGRALVEAVEQFARQSGCERLAVTTQEHRTGAHRFYLRVGLEPAGRRFAKMLMP